MTHKILAGTTMLGALWVSAAVPLLAQGLNQNCVVAVLNRTVQVNPDGTWTLPNIPAGFGLVRARATCVNNGITTFGQSVLFSIQPNRMNAIPPIPLGPVTPIPTSLTLTAGGTTLTTAGQTTQLTVTGLYANGSTANLTAASTGTQYTASNPNIATVGANGLVTAIGSGTAIIQAVNEGAAGNLSIQVALSSDSDGDGIPDDAELKMGLDPHDPTDALLDPDHDGLTNLQEFQLGTDIHNPDTDGDGLTDGQEVLLYKTNPTLLSTDGTGIPDGIEVQTNTLGGSLGQKLSKALKSLSVTPGSFTLVVNSIQGQASQQLTVTGTLIDGKTTIDLTSTQTGTNYQSSDLTICNFGTPDGNVFAGNGGTCTITVTNNGFTATATGTVSGFTPQSLSFVAIPGYANGVAVNGNYAYIAAGGAGLQVVNVTNRSNPVIVSSLALAGNSNDVRLVSNFAYVAGGTAGLQVVDVTNPLAPALRGTLSTGGTALDLVVQGTTAYVANSTGLFIADVTVPASMSKIGSLPLTGIIQGVDVDPLRKLAVVAAGSSGLYVVDISNPAAPAVLGTAFTGDARDAAIKGNYAFVADYQNSTVSVDISNPAAPVKVSNITDPNLGGFLLDIAVSGNFALAADVKFVNGIPITDITVPTNLQARAILNFPQQDDNGMGIAVDGTYAYLVTEHSNVSKFGTTGNSRLYIGQYLALQDLKGIPPTVSITAPVSGSTVVQGSTLTLSANAVDEVAVAAVNFLVNGQVVATSTSYPYQFNYSVPKTATSLTIGATAVDLGGNVGTAQNVTVQAIPDPGTTVTGRVVDRTANPIAGASVAVGALSTTSAQNGTFSLAGVPTVNGSIVVTASATINGITSHGASAPTPAVLGGITNVGDIRVGGGPIGLVHCDSTPAITNALVATGLITASEITPINACGTPPTLATLSAFGGVLVWSNFSFSQPDALGDVLANYVDQGGGVVLATYSFSTPWRIGGRITTTGYSPFTVGNSPTTPSGLLNLANSNTSHSIMLGVPAGPYFTNSNYTNPSLTPGSTLIAVDTAGNNVVSVNGTNRVVGISIYPGFGNMGLLFANALNFVR